MADDASLGITAFRLRLARWAFVLALVAGLAGCGPRAAPSGAGAPAADGAVRDGAVRVVSLAPSLTEIVCVVGGADLLVGRTRVCQYPPEVIRTVPIVGNFGAPSLEMLMSLKPTLVLEVDLEDKTLAAKIDQLGLNRRRIACRSLEDIAGAIRTVGQLIGREEKAGEAARDMEERLAALRALPIAANAPTVFVEIWSDPLMTAGKSSFIASLIRLAGGRNIGDAVENRDYYTVSSEWVVSQDPEIVISLAMVGKSAGLEEMAARTGWSRIRAVRDRRVYQSVNSETLTIPGPRVLQGVEELRGFVQPAVTNGATRADGVR